MNRATSSPPTAMRIVDAMLLLKSAATDRMVSRLFDSFVRTFLMIVFRGFPFSLIPSSLTSQLSAFPGNRLHLYPCIRRIGQVP
jgi:hypothetical protein